MSTHHLAEKKTCMQNPLTNPSMCNSQSICRTYLQHRTFDLKKRRDPGFSHISKGTPTYHLEHTPGLPKPPNQRNSFTKCWFWVWGMFQGYVGKFLEPYINKTTISNNHHTLQCWVGYCFLEFLGQIESMK